MNQEELKAYYDIYTECWKLFKQYSTPMDTKEFWENLTKDSRELTKRFPQKLATELLVATCNEIKRIQKGKLCIRQK